MKLTIPALRELLQRPLQELLQDKASFLTLCALSPELFGRTFFPRTFKHPSPDFHYKIWQELMSPHRYSSVMAFRGSGKTTLTRVYTAARIAFGISRTILFTSASQKHAIYSIDWLKKQIAFNRTFTNYFGLRKGDKWASDEIEIVHEPMGHTVRVVAVGMTGQIRGINIDDARPDLIVCDDPQDDETAATPEQREKLERLFFGALAKSLVPNTEVPEAKMVLLQTPLHREDLISRCEQDPAWHFLRFGCFDEDMKSRWPERFPTEELLKERESHAARNQLSTWLREMECKLVDAESAAFKSDWLKFYDTPPEGLEVVLGIDPAISDKPDADFFAIVAVGIHPTEGYFLLDYKLEKGLHPDAAVATIFTFINRYKPLKIVVETIAYQRALEFLLRREMEKRRQFVAIAPFRDRRNKVVRITQTLSGVAYHGKLWCSPSHKEFITDFCDYPAVSHDDLLDAVSMAISGAPEAYSGLGLDIDEEDDKVVRLGLWRHAV